MAVCEELNLYKETTCLLNMVIPLSQSFPRFFRYNIGNRMLDLILDMMSLIYQANVNTPLEAMNFIASLQKEVKKEKGE